MLNVPLSRFPLSRFSASPPSTINSQPSTPYPRHPSPVTFGVSPHSPDAYSPDNHSLPFTRSRISRISRLPFPLSTFCFSLRLRLVTRHPPPVTSALTIERTPHPEPSLPQDVCDWSSLRNCDRDFAELAERKARRAEPSGGSERANRSASSSPEHSRPALAPFGQAARPFLFLRSPSGLSLRDKRN